MINDIKDLKALFKLCRAQGIIDFKMNGVEIKFGDLPNASRSLDVDEIESIEPTEEELTFYSSDRGQEVLDKKVGMR